MDSFTNKSPVFRRGFVQALNGAHRAVVSDFADGYNARREREGRQPATVRAVQPSVLSADAHGEPAEARALAKAFQKRIAWFEESGGGDSRFVEGFSGETPGWIGVNAHAPSPLRVVAGHELTHEMQKDAPGLYTEFKAALLEAAPDRQAFNEERRARGQSAAQQAQEEAATMCGPRS